MHYTNEEIFCAKYLQRYGLSSPESMLALLEKAKDFHKNYTFVEVAEDYWHSLAEALRPLWPAGSKDGKYEWRGSVTSLASRLETLWKVRNLKDYSIETCVEVARQYLARFQANAKYMQVLPYFILKQKTITYPDGKKRILNQSVFADMLEGANDDVLRQKEWEDLLESASAGEGRLV